MLIVGVLVTKIFIFITYLCPNHGELHCFYICFTSSIARSNFGATC